MLSLCQILFYLPVPVLSFQSWIVLFLVLAVGSYGLAYYCGGKLAGRSVVLLQLVFLGLIGPVAAEQVEKSARPIFTSSQVASLTPGLPAEEAVEILGKPVLVEPSSKGACERWIYTVPGKWQNAQLFFHPKTARLVALEWGQ
ncbi:MAG: hypothetical protein AAF514_07745 [Verrucomicrobiota bacterium]